MLCIFLLCSYSGILNLSYLTFDMENRRGGQEITWWMEHPEIQEPETWKLFSVIRASGDVTWTVWGQTTFPTCSPQPGAHGGLAPGGCKHVPEWEGASAISWIEMTHLSTVVISFLTGTASRSDLEYDIGNFCSRIQINLSLQSFIVGHLKFDRDFGENIPKELSKQNYLSLW